jgi:hypoxanthine phosphoribosyltransferase
MDSELVTGLTQFSELLNKKLPALKIATEEESKNHATGLDRVAPQWAKNIKTILFTEEMIAKRVKEMAKQISQDYKDVTPSEIIVVGLLKGSFIFVADLLRDLTVPHKIDFMVVSSYEGTSSGNLRLKQDLGVDPDGKHILVVEDLIDTGKTLKWMKEHLASKNPASVRLACLLDKPERREVNVHVDYVGYTCPDEFVVGYGMDFDNDYRCMPFVGVLKPEAYARK